MQSPKPLDDLLDFRGLKPAGPDRLEADPESGPLSILSFRDQFFREFISRTAPCKYDRDFVRADEEPGQIRNSRWRPEFRHENFSLDLDLPARQNSSNGLV